MTWLEKLLAEFPYDPHARLDLLRLPHKLRAVEDTELRRLVADAWLTTRDGLAWIAGDDLSSDFDDGRYGP